MLFIVGVLLVCGCAVRVERSGHTGALSPPEDFLPDQTTSQDVARRLGVPDEARIDEQGMRFVYRATRRTERRFLLSYFIKLFSRRSKDARDSTLFIVFDDQGTLVKSWVVSPLHAPAQPF